jgi:hypothetical protein
MKKLVPVLMVVLAAVTLAAVYLWQELRDVRTQTSELRSQLAGLQSAQLAAAAAPVTASPADLQSIVAPVTAPESAPIAAGALPATAAPAEKKTSDALASFAQQLLGTPEGQEMLKAQLRATLPMQYPDLGKELGLSPAETDKLFDILVKQQVSAAGIGLNVLGGNGTQDAAAMRETQRQVQEIQRANQAELASALGDRMPKYEEYQKTLPLRRQVTQLQSALGTGNNALSDAQGKQLIAALAAEQKQIQLERSIAPVQPQQGPRDRQAVVEQQLQRAAEENRRMIDAARTQLNPQQLASYTQMLEQQQNLQRTLTRSISSQSGAQGGGQPSSPDRPPSR